MITRQLGTSSAEAEFALSKDDTAASTRDRLLRKISEETDLPALGGAVSRVVQVTSSDDEAVRNLAHFILSDVALTQKILRIANTVCYRTACGTPVTTVSKAIFLLGFDTVKTSALAMMLVDSMSGRRAQSVRIELNHALCASIVGREMARRSQFKDAEEVAIAALFKNIGRLLVAAHDHELYMEIAKLVEAGSHTPVQASMEVLGSSFDALAEAVLREWNIPHSIVQALAAPPAGVLKPAKTRQEWMQQVAAFSAAASHLIPVIHDPGQEAASKAILTRFGGALNLDQSQLAKLFDDVAQETRELTSNSSFSLQPNEATGDASQAQAIDKAPDAPMPAHTRGGLPVELLLDAAEDQNSLCIVSRHTSGKPVNARDLLLAGVQDVTHMMASGRCKVNDLMLLVLETLYNSMGFRFATVCLKDSASGQYRARITMGQNNEVREAGFRFPIVSSRNLFHLAMENEADLMIADATEPKIRDLLPAWHRALLHDARSFIVLPLVVQKKQLGLFYADRSQPAPEGVPSDETILIKMLKGQVLMALQPR